jgi:putative redox protein
MTDGPHRQVTVERVETGVYRARNDRGDELVFGSADGAGFTPVELLLAAIGGCSAVDVDVVTSRHADPERFEVVVGGDKVRDETGGAVMRDLTMTFHLRFPAGEEGDRARERAPRAVQTSHDRSCTVSRTVEAGVPVRVDLDDGS